MAEKSPERTLYLHVGHPKTGTTWLQSIFLASADRLQRHRIAYPLTPAIATAASTRIQSGNAGRAAGSPSSFRGFLNQNKGKSDVSILMSSESLFSGMQHWFENEAQLRVFLETVCTDFRFSRVKVLLFIRNPVASAASSWQQRAKRSGEVRSIEEFFRSDNRPGTVADFMRSLQGSDRIRLTVRNYSRVSKSLATAAADWLGVPEETFVIPAAEQVNRSMTYAELELQRALNSQIGPSGDILSDPLCEELPDVKSEKWIPGIEAQQALWDKNAPAIEYVNGLVAPEDRYEFDRLDPVEPGERLTLSRAQLELIGRVLGKEIAGLRARALELEATVMEQSAALKSIARASDATGPAGEADRGGNAPAAAPAPSPAKGGALRRFLGRA